MLKLLKKSLFLVLVAVTLFILFAVTPVSAETEDPLSCSFIKDASVRKYVEAMIHFYIYESGQTANTCTVPAVLSALRAGRPAVFLFEGASCKSNTNTNREGAVCIVVRMQKNGAPHIAFYSDSSSTLPDHPLEYGAYSHGKGSQYGTATICDGIYALYVTNHGGSYAAFHVKTLSGSGNIDAVYMKKGGYSLLKANSINVHTRTSAKVSSPSKPWSAGCLLVGNKVSVFNEFISATYPASAKLTSTRYKGYKTNKVTSKSQEAGILIVDRYLGQEAMQKIYKDSAAVNKIVKASKDAHQKYQEGACEFDKHGNCIRCGLCTANMNAWFKAKRTTYAKATPYSASSTVRKLTKGTNLTATRFTVNRYGNIWLYCTDTQGNGYWVYSGDLNHISGKLPY